MLAESQNLNMKYGSAVDYEMVPGLCKMQNINI